MCVYVGAGGREEGAALPQMSGMQGAKLKVWFLAELLHSKFGCGVEHFSLKFAYRLRTKLWGYAVRK